MDLESLDPADEGELTFLIEAAHQGVNPDDMSAVDEPFNPRLHVAMHQVVVNQILGDEPPETWQTVQRLARLGYDWHNIAHMIAALVVHDVHAVLAENRQFDPADYARRLDELPGDWPPPETLR